MGALFLRIYLRGTLCPMINACLMRVCFAVFLCLGTFVTACTYGLTQHTKRIVYKLTFLSNHKTSRISLKVLFK